MTFDTQIADLKNRLGSAQKVLVCLPTQVTLDELASGLALYLSLKASGKSATIASDTITQVFQSNLFGIGDIQSKIPAGGGNYIVALDGVVDPNATDPKKKVPTLEKLDWYPEGQALNLVFHVVPGQRFDPTNISTRHEDGGFDLAFIIGASNLGELGAVYAQNADLFSKTPIVNIDLNPANGNFGAVNIVGNTSATISEIVADVINGTGMIMDADIASNILAGIYNATGNLTGVVDPETFSAAGKALAAGGKIPQITQEAVVLPQVQNVLPQEPVNQVFVPQQNVPNPVMQAPVPSPVSQPALQTDPVSVTLPEAPGVAPLNYSALYQSPFLQGEPQISFAPTNNYGVPLPSAALPQSVPQPQVVQPQPAPSPVTLPPVNQVPQMPVFPDDDSANVDLSQIFGIPPVPKAVAEKGVESKNELQTQQAQSGNAQSSQEEKPMGEYATSHNPEIESQPTPDWLVPKIFKGGNLG